MRDADPWGQSHPIQGTHSGDSIFLGPCQHAGRDRQGLLSSLPELLSPPAPAAGAEHSSPGQAREAAMGGWFPLPSSHSLFVQQRLLQLPGQLFSQSARRRLKPPCLADMSSKGIIKKKRKIKTTTTKIQRQEENIQAAPRHKVSPALSTVLMAV